MNIIELESEEMNLACSIYLAVLYKNTMQCLKSQKVRNFLMLWVELISLI